MSGMLKLYMFCRTSGSLIRWSTWCHHSSRYRGSGFCFEWTVWNTIADHAMGCRVTRFIRGWWYLYLFLVYFPKYVQGTMLDVWQKTGIVCLIISYWMFKVVYIDVSSSNLMEDVVRIVFVIGDTSLVQVQVPQRFDDVKVDLILVLLLRQFNYSSLLKIVMTTGYHIYDQIVSSVKCRHSHCLIWLLTIIIDSIVLVRCGTKRGKI